MKPLFIAWLLLIPTSAFGVSVAAFQVNGIGVFQPGGESISLQTAWVPALELADTWGLRGELGLTFLKGANSRYFFAINYEGFASLHVLPMLAVELGGGVATWVGNGGTHPMASVYLAADLPAVFDRLFIGYSRFFQPDDPAHEIKLGIGFSL